MVDESNLKQKKAPTLVELDKKMKLLSIAFKEYGIQEISGAEDNPEVIKYFNAIGFDGSKLKDETAWCSAFINYCAKKAGLEYTGKLNARSWMSIGAKVEKGKEQLGDVVIFWRESPDSWKGHVGIYINETKKTIFVLGGNQSNQVNIKQYPKSRFLACVRLSEV